MLAPGLKIISGAQSVTVKAVDDISLTIQRGEISRFGGRVWLGKITSGRSILQLVPTQTVRSYFDGT